MKTPRSKENGFVGVLPDGKHCVVIVKTARNAFIAECRACGDHFDNDDSAWSLTQQIAMHKSGTRHGEFVYYAIATLTKGATALESTPTKAAASSSVFKQRRKPIFG